MKDKLFYSIGEISRLTGVPAYTLRYWEKEFKLLRPETDSRGGRRYRRKDLDLIKRIKDLIYQEKYTGKGVKKRIKEEKRAPQEIKNVLNQVRLELESILEMVNR